MPAAPKSWRLHPQSSEAAQHLAYSLKLSPVVAQLLVNRGVTNPADARQFLDTPMAALHAPGLLPGVEAAADMVIAAVRAKTPICIYGDYDVDGTTGTAILVGLLRVLDAAVEFYIPNRLQRGYGLHPEVVAEAAARGVKLIVTVDCGITRSDAAEVARAHGVKLIITDHHEFGADLPAADVLVHPRLPGGTYPNGDLSGAGVAFKLAWAIGQRASGSSRTSPAVREYLQAAMSLAALGLVADVVPLRAENRVFVKHGLGRLGENPSVGLKALLEVCKLWEGVQAGKGVRAEDVAYKLAPRINAAGRLDCALLVVELFTTANPIRAREIAEKLEELNVKRRTIEKQTTDDAVEMVEARGYDADAAIVVASPGWHPGVIGIVASRLVEAYGRPAFVISQPGGGQPGVGSARSVSGYPVNAALAACASLLNSSGGHAAAAGFRVPDDKLDELRQALSAHAAAHFGGPAPPPPVMIESEVPLQAVTFGLLNDLERLEPFGEKNPKPKFLATGLTIEPGGLRRIGATQGTLALRVRQGGTSLRAVGFHLGDRHDELAQGGGECCLVFSPVVNEWNGSRSLELHISDVRAGGEARLD